MTCAYEIWQICFAATMGEVSIFPFKDFIAALALLIIIYTTSDVRYQFRVSVAPFALYPITFWLIVFIGAGTLITDVWISEKWLVPNSLITQAIWQGIFGALFLGLVLTWMYYAFITPPVFGRRNCKKYANTLFRIILKGSDAELASISYELANSAEALVKFSGGLTKELRDTKKESPEGYANDLLLLIANRKFCRNLVASSTITAIRLLEAASKETGRRTSIGLFARNISIEAIRNTDSISYHEGDWFDSGLLGHIKPFSTALYGNFKLIESLGNNSPLDIDYDERDAWNSRQFEVYCRAVLMTFNNYLDEGLWGYQCYSLNKAISNIQNSISNAIQDLSKTPDNPIGDAWHRLMSGVQCINGMIDLIGKLNPPPRPRTLRIHTDQRRRMTDEDLYDRIADAMFEIIHSAARIKGTSDELWGIQHNSVWGEFFSRHDEGIPRKIVLHKLRRLLFDEIMNMETLPNYKNASILGFCLNVMGLKLTGRSGYGRQHAALKAVLLPWVQKNYNKLRKINPDIADACLIGSITYDEKESRLVKTYIKGLNLEPPKDYLPIDQ